MFVFFFGLLNDTTIGRDSVDSTSGTKSAGK